MKKVLNETKIKSIKPPKSGQAEHYDAQLPGFGLRVTPKGTKSFIFLYRVDGKQKRATLGRYPALSLAEARAQARDILDHRNDPEEEKYSEDTYAEAVAVFIKEYAIRKKGNRRWKVQQQLLMNAGRKFDNGKMIRADSGWAESLITDITRKDIRAALNARMEAGTPYIANRTFEALRTFYRWLYREDYVAVNLMDKFEKPFDGEAVSERVWTDEEIRSLWTSKLDGLWTSCLRLMLLMGQRKSEIAGMLWSEIDLDEGVWILSKERHKGKRGHAFPLSALAVRILKGIPKVKDCPFVFPGRSDGPLNANHRAQKRIQKASGIDDFTYKTARHTFRTGLDKLKVPPHVKLEC